MNNELKKLVSERLAYLQTSLRHVLENGHEYPDSVYYEEISKLRGGIENLEYIEEKLMEIACTHTPPTDGATIKANRNQ